MPRETQAMLEPESDWKNESFANLRWAGSGTVFSTTYQILIIIISCEVINIKFMLRLCFHIKQIKNIIYILCKIKFLFENYEKIIKIRRDLSLDTLQKS